MIQVTQPFMPPQEEYQKLLDGVWERKWLTNHGPLSNEFEERIKARFSQPFFNAVSSGTLALQLAYKVLGLKGEVITTPFSYVATTSSLVWEGLKPVFADINPNTLNIDPISVEKKITEKTRAIVATHVYGNPCDIDALEAIAKKYGLKLIFDAAHAFDSTYKGKSIFQYGDISTVSFHATKLFHTIEGGGIFTKDEELRSKVYYAKNFGHHGEVEFKGVGINSKLSEFNAAMGWVNLKYIDEIAKKKFDDYHQYKSELNDTNLVFQSVEKLGSSNFSYCPVLFENESVLLKVRSSLEQSSIAARRYFYPPLNTLPYITIVKCPIAEDISKRILCLPTFYDLASNTISKINSIIKETLA